MSDVVFKDFDEGRRKVDTKKAGPEWGLADQRFTSLPALPGGMTGRVARSIGTDDRGRQVYNAPDVIGFIHDSLIRRRWVTWEFEGEGEADDRELSDEQRQSITDEGGYWEPADDRERFLKITEEDEDIVELETLVKVMTYIAEQAGERPTRRSKR